MFDTMILVYSVINSEFHKPTLSGINIKIYIYHISYLKQAVSCITTNNGYQMHTQHDCYVIEMFSGYKKGKLKYCVKLTAKHKGGRREREREREIECLYVRHMDSNIPTKNNHFLFTLNKQVYTTHIANH